MIHNDSYGRIIPHSREMVNQHGCNALNAGETGFYGLSRYRKFLLSAQLSTLPLRDQRHCPNALRQSHGGKQVA